MSKIKTRKVSIRSLSDADLLKAARQLLYTLEVNGMIGVEQSYEGDWEFSPEILAFWRKPPGQQ